MICKSFDRLYSYRYSFFKGYKIDKNWHTYLARLMGEKEFTEIKEALVTARIIIDLVKNRILR